MKNSKTKTDNLREYADLVRDYFDFENECHAYFSKFFSSWSGGKLVNVATKGDTSVEFKKRQEMRNELEKKRKKVMEAQEKYLAL